MSKYYESRVSDDYDFSQCNMVKALLFNSSIEAVGVSYKRNFKTIKELEEEKAYIQSNFSENEVLKCGIIAQKRVRQIEEEIFIRKSKYNSVGKNKVDKEKSKSEQSVKKAYKRLNSILKANFDRPFVKCATLTYEERQFDFEKVKHDSKVTRKKLKYKFKEIKYVEIIEPYEDGAFHIHFVYANAPNLTRKIFTELWGKGFVFVEDFNVLTSPYFTKVNERIKFYPSGSRIFTYSKNLSMPKEIILTSDKLEDIVKQKNMKCYYESAKDLFVIDENGNEKKVNHFVYKNYK